MRRFPRFQRLTVIGDGQERHLERTAEYGHTLLRGPNAYVEWFPMRDELEIAGRGDDIFDPRRLVLTLGDFLMLLGLDARDCQNAILRAFRARHPAFSGDDTGIHCGPYTITRGAQGWDTTTPEGNSTWFDTLDEAAEAIEGWLAAGKGATP